MCTDTYFHYLPLEEKFSMSCVWKLSINYFFSNHWTQRSAIVYLKRKVRKRKQTKKRKEKKNTIIHSGCPKNIEKRIFFSWWTYVGIVNIFTIYHYMLNTKNKNYKNITYFEFNIRLKHIFEGKILEFSEKIFMI